MFKNVIRFKNFKFLLWFNFKGDLHPQDMLDLIESIKIVLKNMNIKVPIEE